MNIDDLEDISCSCGSIEFIQTFMMKKIPAMISQTGKEQVGPFPARFVCTNCGRDVYDLFIGTQEEKSPIIM